MDEFYKELANEILFIIANQNRPGLPVEKLCLEFEKRVGNKLVNIVGVEEHQFVRPSTPNLVRLLLQAGGDRLAVQTNKKGQNVLHVIAGRMRAEENSNGDLVFQNEKNDGFPNTKNRMAVLKTLTEQLSPDQLTVLVTAQDEIGDTDADA
ncbi:Hypothetical predicted protein [Paramuricea clavata]|uniref:Uncharacterized protein n=1 Tax=Paramuricea clavata TaxID=317549 RepID=A0A6S7KJZ7_PARCT|nr:Hypothetical predicted protein [Paramuricea clavata]